MLDKQTNAAKGRGDCHESLTAMWAAAQGPVRVMPIMSNLRFYSALGRFEFIHSSSTQESIAGPAISAQTTNDALDSALRRVPLPEGLMTRLGKMICKLSDETADQTDCLGC
jgi:hypothetical protein